MYGPEYLEWQEQCRIDGLVKEFLARFDAEDRERVFKHFEKRLKDKLRLYDEQLRRRPFPESDAFWNAQLTALSAPSAFAPSPFDLLGNLGLR